MSDRWLVQQADSGLDTQGNPCRLWIVMNPNNGCLVGVVDQQHQYTRPWQAVEVLTVVGRIEDLRANRSAPESVNGVRIVGHSDWSNCFVELPPMSCTREMYRTWLRWGRKLEGLCEIVSR